KGNYDPSSSGGQELLAHELTHVVQQSGGTASRRIRRFVTVKDFAERTDEGLFTTKGPAQKEIEKQLTAYLALGETTKRPKDAKPHPSGVTVQLTMPPEKLDQALGMLRHMKTVAELWVASKTTDTTDKTTGKTTTKIDPSRAKRGAGMVWFLMACDGEIARIETMKTKSADAGKLAKQTEVKVDDSGLAKLKEKYTGGLGGGLSVASTVLGKAIANDGDSTEFELDMKIPVSPGVFVGAILRFEGSKKKGNTEVAVDAMFQAGGTLGVFNIHGALGGYFKASAKSPEGAMKLISYGFYRRCRESDVIPSGLSNSIWGGENSSREVADKWSLEVEDTELQNDDSYVETGVVGEVGADADLGKAAQLGAGAKASTGKRHDKKSLDKTKGGAGQKNETNILAGETSTGRSVHAIELSAKASVLGGNLAGDLKLNLNWRDSLDGKGAVFDGLEVQFRASGRMPAAGLDGAIAGLVGNFAKTAVTVFSKQFQAAQGTDQLKKMAVPSLTLAKSSTEVTLQSLEGIGVTEAIKANTLDQLFTPAPKAPPGTTPTGPTSESTVGIELALHHAKGVSSSTTTFEIRHLTALDAKIPSLLKVELVRRSRLLAWQSSGSGWTMLR
ncbi:MAG: hypothetical protein JWN29_3664, partial [Acidimicrobiales bacterium]|nr:hypothetical protein [Acidimicrobiales bacterium]